MKKAALLVLLLNVSLLAFEQGKGKGHGHGGGGNPPPPPPPPVTCVSGSSISMDPRAWCVVDYSQTFNPTPTANGWMFPFPPGVFVGGSTIPDSVVDVTTDVPASFAPTQSMRITFRLVANNAVWQTTDYPNLPDADFSLFFEHANNTQNNFTWRWWAFPEKYIIQNGTYDVTVTLSVPLQPQFWGDVNGMNGATDSTTIAGFMDTLANVGKVGIEVGSGRFAGHGTDLVSGTATMEVNGFSVQ